MTKSLGEQDLRLRTRKQRRQLQRKLVKAKRKAWTRGEKVPTSVEQIFVEKNRLKKSRQKKKKKKRTVNEEEEASSEELQFDEEDWKERRRLNLMEDNRLEDQNIKKIEKLLKIKAERKNWSSGFVNDGLDYLLDFCDQKKRKEILREEKQSAGDLWQEEETDDDDDDDDRLWLKSKKKKRLEEERSETEQDDLPTMNQKKSTVVRFNDQIETKFIESSSEGESLSDDEHLGSAEESDKVDKTAMICRTRSNDQKSIYVPPALRESLNSFNEPSTSELKRKIQGQLNRLSENNFHSIFNQIEMIYRSNARALVNKALLQFYEEILLSEQSLTSENLVSEYALLVSLLHGNIAIEIGSFILENFVVKLRKHVDDDVSNKTSDNVVRFLSYLYAFNVNKGKLIIDLCRYIIEFDQINEKRLELILHVLRTVGFVLRKENPLELKEILQKLRSVSLSSPSQLCSSSSTRFHYLIETIHSLKNNDVRKLPGSFEPERIDRLRSIARQLTKDKSVQQSNILNVSLDDLFNGNERGRWWIVGSAWSKSQSSNRTRPTEETESRQSFNDEILRLAKEQKMNTDIRRVVFATLMTSQDCDDALEKLNKLKLNRVQEREIIHVTVHCCLQEKCYNPFYSLVLQRLLNFDRRFQICFQCHIWDRFKELSSINQQQIINLASTLLFLIENQNVNLNIFKTFNFMELTEPAKNFLLHLFVQLFERNDEKSLKTIFQVPKKSNWKFLQGALKLFLCHFIVKKAKYPDEVRRRCQFALEHFVVE